MSINLSTYLSEKLPSAFNKLVESDRIHKKDLNALHSVVKKISKVEASQVPLSSMVLILKMGPYAKDPRSLQNSFSTLFSKLDRQKSTVHEYKQAKLEYIQRGLTQFVDNIQHTQTQNQLDNINSEINKISKSISGAENKIHQRNENVSIAAEKIKVFNNEIKSLVTTVEETSDEEFAALDAKRAEALKTQYDADITLIDDQINEQRDLRTALLDFAQAHEKTRTFPTGKRTNTVEKDIHLAEENTVYFNDFGYVRTLSKHMCSDEYAMKKFGHTLVQVPGRYGDSSEKIPNARAREWQRMMKTFNQSPGINDLAHKKEQLAAEYKNRSEAITNINSSIGEILNKIEHRYKNINKLEQQIKTESEHIESTKNTANELAIKKENLLKRKEKLYAQIDNR